MAENVDGTVRQVQTSEGLYDIEAPKIVEENDYTAHCMHIKTASNESGLIKFNVVWLNSTPKETLL